MSTVVVASILAALVGAGAGYAACLMACRRRGSAAEVEARRSAEEAAKRASEAVKQAELQAKADMLKWKEEFEQNTASRRKEVAAAEERIAQRELNLDRKVSMLDKKEHALDEKIKEVEAKSAEIEKDRAELQRLSSQARQKLQEVAGMSQEDARRELMVRVEKEVHGEMGAMIRRMQEQARETAERESRKIIVQAIQRFAAPLAGETMTSTVALPNDDMKGRIIGREGRNIRALEAATGVNVLIDDTPEAVVISGFDPVRREIARIALEGLIADGRIHPARIEEIVAKTQENMQETIRSAGEEAAYLSGVQGIEPELLRMVGRLKFRTSYTQNVLQHSIEVAHLMGVMAGELQLDVSLAKRIGLFHDIGKALDHEVEGSHAVIGADLLKKNGEAQVVVNAVAAHHEEVPQESLYATLAVAADAISSSRVGARSETTGIYVKRLEKLEAVANGFEGVEKSYAIQAGREVRVLVSPDRMDDNGAAVMARNISKKIETDLQYPGQIRVVVIREKRCVEYAK
ncbi:MAG: ribonuclease Y [Lentisphaerae bacterium]|nr:ribonuclease Y [Lentisphaerota bacterium]